MNIDELRKIAEREEARYRWVTLSPEGVIELLDRVEKAEHELEKYDRRLEKTENEYNRLETSHSILEQALQRVREALARHPECDRYDEGPISCGWKRVVADITASLEGDNE